MSTVQDLAPPPDLNSYHCDTCTYIQSRKVTFVDIDASGIGVFRFGFTTHDPASFAHSLPKYNPDLLNKPGIWVRALSERFCENDNILYYYVNSAGYVHFGINGAEKGLFYSGMDMRKDTLSLIPLSLHRTKGRNVQYVNDRGVAARFEDEFCQGYVFTARPMRPRQTIVVQVLVTEAAYAGSLTIGLTSCGPSTLRTCDLPDDAEWLLDRPEYWVVRRDAANGMRRGDKLAVTLTLDGEVQVSRNWSIPITIMHVDHTLRKWAFVDICGATQKVRILSSQRTQTPPQQLGVIAGSAPLSAGAGGTDLVQSGIFGIT
ncbi:putative neuralized [Operophtera brumata]|uniref:Putative neuralized n=1 Tax=Operophtera brumata TaxID=104452 RepID=A0A0L7L3C5_OPEBR|nr:putative neuralized [Operophtera brumata]